MVIRKVSSKDKMGLYALHQQVAKNHRGIARMEDEITAAYIDRLIGSIQSDGIMLVGIDEVSQKLIAEIHATKYGIKIFDHILTNLTVVVHPDFQSKGFGKKIFYAFLDEVLRSCPEIERIELECRFSNKKSIALYRQLGFEVEGILKNKAKNKDGSFEDCLSMAWIKPLDGFSHAE